MNLEEKKEERKKVVGVQKFVCRNTLVILYTRISTTSRKKERKKKVRICNRESHLCDGGNTNQVNRLRVPVHVFVCVSDKTLKGWGGFHLYVRVFQFILSNSILDVQFLLCD